MARWKGSWILGVWLGTAILAGGTAGCEAKSEGEPEKQCSKDSDCSGEQTCLLTSVTQQPMVFNPCSTIVPCTDSSNCGSGMVCGPYVPPSPSIPGVFQCPPKTCITSCQTSGCSAGSVCSDTGVCRLLKCDEPDGPACAAHYRCDSAEALSRPAMAFNGSSVLDPQSPERQAQIGCVRKLCDEPDGFVCRDTWKCDPANAPTEASGCVPLACSETGKCWDDSYSICEPQNDGPRPSGTDMHGCVVRNCGEGYQCQQIKDSVNYSYCALDAPDADPWGCLVRNCEERPEVCGDGRTCDRAAPLKDVFGCRTLDCNDPTGPQCPAGSTCVLLSEQSGLHSCMADGSGGSGGGAGNGGSAGATLKPPAGGASGAGSGGAGAASPTGGRISTAGSSTGGLEGGRSTNEPTVSGVCVARE